jgi:hypothetical protein
MDEGPLGRNPSQCCLLRLIDHSYSNCQHEVLWERSTERFRRQEVLSLERPLNDTLSAAERRELRELPIAFGGW